MAPSTTMRQGVLQAPGELELREVPLPALRPGELLVRVDLALTCGTDLKTFRRGHPLFPAPTPLGHEYTGTVARAGEGSRFREGDAVLAAPSAPCGACRPCGRGDENLCDDIDGSTMAWGAFADYIRVPARVAARNVFHRPRGLDLTRAALLEPLSCVVNGVGRLDLARADSALVMGAGPIGLLFVALLKHRGVPRVAVLGKRAPRLAAARDLGADPVIDLDAGEDVRGALEDALPGGPRAVVECVGRPEAWSQALDLVPKGGEVLLYGGCAAGTQVPVDAHRIHYHGLTIKGAFHFAPSDVRVALDLIKSRALPLERLVSGRYPLERLGDVFTALEGGDCLKLAVVPAAGADA